MVTARVESGAGARAANRYRRPLEEYRSLKLLIAQTCGQTESTGDDADQFEDASADVANVTIMEGNEDEQGEEGQSNAVATVPAVRQPMPGSRHIRPCICDLTASALKRISEYRSQRTTFYGKLAVRRAEIEEELKRKKQEALERERDKADQHELFEDDYEMTATGSKKRKKRSARRVSMVSLGVRTIIKWKGEPKIKVVLNRAWHLRKCNTRYCGLVKRFLPDIEVIDYKKKPLVPVRGTNAFGLRCHFNDAYKRVLTALEDKRPPFVLFAIT